MADEPSPLSTIPPALLAEGDYDAICASLRQTERGRQFLEEHARRHQDTGSEASPQADTAEEPARIDILAAVERLQDLAWIMREHGLDFSTCDNIEKLTSLIAAAPSLYEAADDRAQQLGQALSQLEHYIDSKILAARTRQNGRGTTYPPELAVPVIPVIAETVSQPSAPDGFEGQPTEPLSVIAFSTLSESKEADLIPPASDIETTPSAAEEVTGTSLTAMWESWPIPPSGAEAQAEAGANPSPKTPAAEDDDLFTSQNPGPPGADASAALPAGPGKGAAIATDQIAALTAMSDEEKIALFT